MTKITRSRNEYFEPTADSNNWPLLGEQPLTQTDARPQLRIVWLGHDESTSLPEGFVDIDELVAKEEQTRDGNDGLQQARRELARALDAKIGPSLRSYRLARGMSQEALGRMIGTTQAHMARIESGKTDVQVGTVLRIARALNIDPNDALGAFLAKYAVTPK